MKKILFWFLLIAFGFILGAGVGFKVLEGISTQLVVEAFDNSYSQFKNSYSGSASQKAVQATITDKLAIQKDLIKDQIQSGLQNYALQTISSLFK